MKKVLVIFILFSLWSFPALGADHYFATDGNDTTGDGTIGNPWKTVSKAFTEVGNGETGYFRAGTFPITSAGLSPVAGSTFSQYESEVVTWSFTGSGTTGNMIVLTGADDGVTFDGLILDGNNLVAQGIGLVTTDGVDNITIKNSTIREFFYSTGGAGIWAGTDIEFNNLLIDNCIIHSNGGSPANQSGGNIHLRGPGSGVTIKNSTIYNAGCEDGVQIGSSDDEVTNIVIEDSTFYGNHENGIDIKYVSNVVINNVTVYNHVDSLTGGGEGIVIHDSAENVLIDNSLIYNNVLGITIGSQARGHITIRRTTIRDNQETGSNYGIVCNDDGTDNLNSIYLLNNTIQDNDTGFLQNSFGTAPNDVVFLNNIFSNNASRDIRVQTGTTITDSDYDTFDDSVASPYYYSGSGRTIATMCSSYSFECNANTSDPLFTSEGANDFTLQSGSPCIDTGTHYTEVAAGDSGSGTTLIVDEAGFFQADPGGAVSDIVPDWIAIKTVTNVHQISTINYSTNTITLATDPGSRSENDSIWLYKDSGGSIVLYGPTLDIGANEYWPGTGIANPGMAGTYTLENAEIH